MKNLAVLGGFILILAGCGSGGGSPGSVSSDSSNTLFSEPVLIAHKAWGGFAVRSLSTEVQMRSALNNTHLQFMTFDITLPVEEMNLFSKEEKTYHVSFWDSFVLVGTSGKEIRPMPENSGSGYLIGTSDTKRLAYQYFGDVGACLEGVNGFINCGFLYELPDGFEIDKAYFMNESRFIEVEVDIPL